MTAGLPRKTSAMARKECVTSPCTILKDAAHIRNGYFNLPTYQSFLSENLSVLIALSGFGMIQNLPRLHAEAM